MKKNILFGFAAGGAMLLSANVASAQEAVVIEEAVISETEVECGDHYYSGKGDNWFIQLSAGMELPIVEHFPTDAKRHITAAYGVGFGKWFSPYLAWRVSGQMAAYHFNASNDPNYRKAKFINGNFDLMWDMFNSFEVNSKRIFSVVPFVGVGVSYSYDMTPGNIAVNGGHIKTKCWQVPVSVGMQLRFRLSKTVDFFAEGRYSFYGDTFDNIAYGSESIDMNLTAMGGFTFNIGGRSFKKFNPCTYVGYINQLNGQINDLRGALATCGAALAAAEAKPCPEVVAVECPDAQAPLMSTVRFTINSAKVTDKEMVNVYNIAQWMKANPETNVVIKGYADKNTGTAAYNMKLSERRAQSVYNILTKEYGINPDRLTMKAEGSDSQVYDTNNWNRIVIFSQD